MILNLHGFASAGSGRKAKWLRELFPEEKVISPDLPIAPRKVVKKCLHILEKHGDSTQEKRDFIVGTSLGGFYAYHLSAVTQTPCLLINPSLIPFITMTSRIGEQKNLKTGDSFIWERSYLKDLAKLFQASYLKVPIGWANIVVH